MTNVKLSKEEMTLVTDAGFILTKNRIIQKVYDLFGEVSQAFTATNTALPPEVLAIHPKIAKGENYQGLPWVMLDYPRRFSATDVFAVRCFFWWGHFFSITLQLQGKYQHQYAPLLQKNLPITEWWVGTGSDAWQHHFDDGNYSNGSSATDLIRLPFIKLAKKIPLSEWDNAFEFYTVQFAEITRALST